MRGRSLAARAFVLVTFACAGIVVGQTVESDLGWKLTVDAAAGKYRISAADTGWSVGGEAGGPFGGASVSGGSDGIGAYREIAWKWTEEGRRSGGIRLYKGRPLAVFSETFDDAVSGSPKAFPTLSELPAGVSQFRYAEDDHLRPPQFTLAPREGNDPKRPKMEGGEEYGGPFVLFDGRANALVLSPADDFMVAQMRGDVTHGIESALNRTLKSVPAGYAHRTILAMGPGINRTFDTWGRGLTDLHGKKRPASDADAGLKYLGYWTDNGAAYYYHYDLAKGYANTLLAVKAHLDSVGVPIRYMQLDSWWYPKSFKSVQAGASDKPRSKDPSIPAGTWNRYGGALEYAPHPDLFPEGLAAFQKKLGVKLIAHTRWVDPESPYVKEYKVSGIAPVDPKLWDKVMGDLASWGVETYEQDWNNYIYLRSPELYETTWAGEAYMDGMAESAARRGMTMQYCMVLPRHLMQGGAKYPNLTTVRVSGDRLDRGKWREFMCGSQMASALGVWPWTDVFRSKETGNFVVCSLSGGMVGLADAMGEEDAANIFRAVRRDGVIVKPDVPMTPADATYLAEAAGGQAGAVLVGSARSAHAEAGPAGEARYVFAFHRKAGPSGAGVPWSIDPRSLGLEGEVFVYDVLGGKGHLARAGSKVEEHLGDEGWSYRVLAPVGVSGMALVGDAGLFVTRGKQRIAAVRDDRKELGAIVLFAANEAKLTLAAYAPAKPAVEVRGGIAGDVRYDAATGLATVEVAVDPALAPTGTTDPVREMAVTFKLP